MLESPLSLYAPVLAVFHSQSTHGNLNHQRKMSDELAKGCALSWPGADHCMRSPSLRMWYEVWAKADAGISVCRSVHSMQAAIRQST